MKFTVTFKENPFFIFVLLLSGASIWMGLTAKPHDFNNVGFAAIGLSVVCFLFIIRFRFYVLLTEQALEVRRFLGSQRVRWTEIRKVKSVMEEIYKKTGRVGAPYAYDFIAGDQTIRINFKMFSRDCAPEVFKRIPQDILPHKHHSTHAKKAG